MEWLEGWVVELKFKKKKVLIAMIYFCIDFVVLNYFNVSGQCILVNIIINLKSIT